MAQELLSDGLTYLMFLDHLMNLRKGCPLGPVGFPGLQHYLHLGRIPVQAIVIIVCAPLSTGVQKFKFLRGCNNTGGLFWQSAGFFILLVGSVGPGAWAHGAGTVCR